MGLRWTHKVIIVLHDCRWASCVQSLLVVPYEWLMMEGPVVLSWILGAIRVL